MKIDVKRRMADTDNMGRAALAARFWVLQRQALPVHGIGSPIEKIKRKRKNRTVTENIYRKNLVVRHNVIELIEHWSIAISGLVLF